MLEECCQASRRGGGWSLTNASAWSAGEQIFSSLNLSPGMNGGLCFPVPAAALGPSYARFRLSNTGGLSPTGAASNGEVEDYQVTICQPVPSSPVVVTNISWIRVGTNQVFTFKWNAQANTVYRWQQANSLSNAPAVTWSDLAPDITGPINVFTITNPPVLQRYYRILVPYTCP